MKFAVLGDPVKHSLSPKIFAYLKNHFQLDFSYEVLELTPEDFLKNPEILKKYNGLNITSPYKERILEFCQKKSTEVEFLGAANVLENKNGFLSAYNTDVAGFQKSLTNNNHKKWLILGGGGAAKACGVALVQMGATEIQFKLRDQKKAEQISNQFSSFYANLKSDVKFSPYFNDLNTSPFIAEAIVNATTLGLKDYTERDLQFFNLNYSDTELAYDLMYKEQITPFMKVASQNGARHVKNGLDMLILQALETFEIWFFKIENKEIILRKMKESL